MGEHHDYHNKVACIIKKHDIDFLYINDPNGQDAEDYYEDGLKNWKTNIIICFFHTPKVVFTFNSFYNVYGGTGCEHFFTIHFKKQLNKLYFIKPNFDISIKKNYSLIYKAIKKALLFEDFSFFNDNQITT